MKIVRYVMAAVAVLFGLATLKSGGSVLFGSEEARVAAGDYVPFVVWFNFTAGFGYVIAGAGIAFRQGWAHWLAAIIAATSAVTFAVFGFHIAGGGAYELRTVIAMSIRTGLWAGIAVALFRMSTAPAKSMEVAS